MEWTAIETIVNALKTFAMEESLVDWGLAALGKMLAGK